MTHKGIYTSKISKINLTTDAEYAANLVNVVANVQQCTLLRGYMLYLHNDTFLTDIIGYYRLKFGQIYTPKMNGAI